MITVKQNPRDVQRTYPYMAVTKNKTIYWVTKEGFGICITEAYRASGGNTNIVHIDENEMTPFYGIIEIEKGV